MIQSTGGSARGDSRVRGGDYIGFDRILGHELATRFQLHAEKFGAEIRTSTPVEGIAKRADGLFETRVEDGDVLVSRCPCHPRATPSESARKDF